MPKRLVMPWAVLLFIGAIVCAELPLAKASSAATQGATTKLSEERIITFLRRGVSAAEVQRVVERDGVDFAVDSQVEAELRSAGASDALLQAIREVSPAAPPAAAPEAPPAAMPEAPAAPAPEAPLPQQAAPTPERTPTSLKVFVVPDDASALARILIDGSSATPGQELDMSDKENEQVTVDVSADGYKRVTQEVSVSPGLNELTASLCRAQVIRSEWEQPPDRQIATTERLGSGSETFNERCPSSKPELRALADNACETTYPGSRHDYRRVFDVDDGYKRDDITHIHNGVVVAQNDVDLPPDICRVTADCIRTTTTVETPKPVLVKRVVENDSCESEIKLRASSD